MTGTNSARKCFADNYAQARDWFLAACREAGVDVQSFPLKDQVGKLGEELAVDIAWFGKKDAPRIYLSISGTHGQEFFCGAAGQLNWVRNFDPAKLPDNTAVCLVHGYNPYGASYGSRGNENFVDLNRNYFDPGTEIRPNKLYPELFELLQCSEMSLAELDVMMAGFYNFVEKHDAKEAMTAMGGGQNTHPSGILYCGNGDETSTTALRAYVDEHLSHAEKVAIIDWHTGLGEYGEMTVLLEQPIETDRFRWACAWWGGPEANEKLEPVETRADEVGLVNEGVEEQLRDRGVEAIGTVVELGTVDNEAVLGALLIDRWLRFDCDDTSSAHATRFHTLMMDRLNPTLPSWRDKVLENMETLYERTITGLSLWDSK